MIPHLIHDITYRVTVCGFCDRDEVAVFDLGGVKVHHRGRSEGLNSSLSEDGSQGMRHSRQIQHDVPSSPVLKMIGAPQQLEDNFLESIVVLYSSTLKCPLPCCGYYCNSYHLATGVLRRTLSEMPITEGKLSELLEQNDIDGVALLIWKVDENGFDYSISRRGVKWWEAVGLLECVKYNEISNDDE